MRVAILSDIHGNLEAFEAVVADITSRAVDRIVCLGDMIGYGPDPEAVVSLVRAIGCSVILGNHESALISEGARRWMNFQARENNIRTEQLLSGESREYCRNLPRSLTLAGALFVHGFPPDSVFVYLSHQSDRRIAELFASSPVSLFVLGHTHELQLVRAEAGGIVRLPLDKGIVRISPAEKTIVNAGSVGQPRDRDKSAKYLIWDQSAQELDVRFIPYDCEATVRKIRLLGFPDAYAERLCRS